MILPASVLQTSMFVRHLNGSLPERCKKGESNWRESGFLPASEILPNMVLVSWVLPHGLHNLREQYAGRVARYHGNDGGGPSLASTVQCSAASTMPMMLTVLSGRFGCHCRSGDVVRPASASVSGLSALSADKRCAVLGSCRPRPVWQLADHRPSSMLRLPEDELALSATVGSVWKQRNACSDDSAAVVFALHARQEKERCISGCGSRKAARSSVAMAEKVNGRMSSRRSSDITSHEPSASTLLHQPSRHTSSNFNWSGPDSMQSSCARRWSPPAATGNPLESSDAGKEGVRELRFF